MSLGCVLSCITFSYPLLANTVHIFFIYRSEISIDDYNREDDGGDDDELDDGGFDFGD